MRSQSDSSNTFNRRMVFTLQETSQKAPSLESGDEWLNS